MTTGRSVDRDRDPAGRARNARPRDALGRPMPYGSPDVPRQPEGLRRSPQQTIELAQRLLDDGLPFHAHEVFEDAWKIAPDDERQLWKGLAQLAVGLTHLERGNRRGAAALLLRGSVAVAPFAQDPPHGLATAGLLAWAAELQERMAAAEPDDQWHPDHEPAIAGDLSGAAAGSASPSELGRPGPARFWTSPILLR